MGGTVSGMKDVCLETAYKWIYTHTDTHMLYAYATIYNRLEYCTFICLFFLYFYWHYCHQWQEYGEYTALQKQNRNYADTENKKAFLLYS